MPRVTDTGSGGVRPWPPAFDDRVVPPVAFLTALSALLVVSNLAVTGLLGPSVDPALRQLAVIPFDIATILLVLAVVRWESVRVRALGLAPGQARPAVLAFLVLVVALNAAVVALVLLGGGDLSVGFLYDHSTGGILARVVSLYVFAALSEELAIRGYLQNKLVSLAGGGRLGTAFGIGGASVAFALIHLPRFLVGGVPIRQRLPALALLLFTGIGFGLIYEVTRNLYLVTLIHGLGNYWLLAIDPGPWPNWPLIVVVYVVVVLAYRRLAVPPAR